nr:MAG TPA_asm: zinc-ribbon domain protein [Caudoviricetes sp.]
MAESSLYFPSDVLILSNKLAFQNLGDFSDYLEKKQVIIIVNLYRYSPLLQEMPMSGRKNTQTHRNYLVKCPCPNCSKDSEHSFSRVQKGAQLVCPFCSTLFKSK